MGVVICLYAIFKTTLSRCCLHCLHVCTYLGCLIEATHSELGHLPEFPPWHVEWCENNSSLIVAQETEYNWTVSVIKLQFSVTQWRSQERPLESNFLRFMCISGTIDVPTYVDPRLASPWSPFLIVKIFPISRLTFQNSFLTTHPYAASC